MKDALSSNPVYIRARPKSGGPWCYMERCELQDMIDGSDPDKYEVEDVRMTHEEWEALPEFEGW
jgi:hypothetical protein